MNDQRNLLVGLDLGDDFTQMSCFHVKENDPESVSFNGNDTFLIPTVLCVTNESKEWLYGVDAVEKWEKEEAVRVDHLVEKAMADEPVTIFDISFTAAALLEKFFRKTLSALKRIYPNDSIMQLVVTVEETSEMLNKNIYQALEALGLGKDRVLIKSHAVVAMYYAVNQERQLWMNDIGIFHNNGSRLYFYHVAINRKTKPSAVTVKKEDLTEAYTVTGAKEPMRVGEQTEEMAQRFHRIAKLTLSKYTMSAVYITGKGFEGSWIDPTLQELCLGRRIFKGQNLYTKGASYLAREQKGDKKLQDFILLGDEMLHSTVWMSAYVNAKMQEVVLAQIGTPWFEVNRELDFIVDGKAEVCIHSKSLFHKETKTYKLVLDSLPPRPNKMTRVRLSLRCNEPDHLDIELRDLGFGDHYPATDSVCNKHIPLM